MIRQAIGFICYGFKHPFFAFQLLRCRIDFLLHRKLNCFCIDPLGFRIDSPGKLFTWWGLFIEQQLVCPIWTNPLTRAASPQVIDIGANAGLFTHLVLNLNPTTRITAVEPQPQLVKLIENYAEQHRKSIKCITAACSDQKGQADLFFENEGDVRASLDPSFAAHQHQIKVTVTTVDAIAPPGEIFLLKIDAEGHDIEVLKGATNTLERTRFVMIECHGGKNLVLAKNLLKERQCKKIGKHDFLFYRLSQN